MVDSAGYAPALFGSEPNLLLLQQESIKLNKMSVKRFNLNRHLNVRCRRSKNRAGALESSDGHRISVAVTKWSQVSVLPRLHQVYKTRWIAESQGEIGASCRNRPGIPSLKRRGSISLN